MLPDEVVDIEYSLSKLFKNYKDDDLLEEALEDLAETIIKKSVVIETKSSFSFGREYKTLVGVKCNFCGKRDSLKFVEEFSHQINCVTMDAKAFLESISSKRKEEDCA